MEVNDGGLPAVVALKRKAVIGGVMVTRGVRHIYPTEMLHIRKIIKTLVVCPFSFLL